MAESYTGNQPDQREVLVLEEQARALMQAVPDLVFLLGIDGSYIDIFSAGREDEAVVLRAEADDGKSD